MTVMTTGGLSMLIFYESNAYLIMAGWLTMAVPSTMYIVVNTNEQCKRFPKKTGLTLGLINGLFDAGAGMFLTFKELFLFFGKTRLTKLIKV